jgi:hypothetical protein
MQRIYWQTYDRKVLLLISFCFHADFHSTSKLGQGSEPSVYSASPNSSNSLLSINEQ